MPKRITPLNRRAVLVAGSIAPWLAAAQQNAAASPAVHADFPRENSQFVREVVGAAHTDEKKVRELVEARPSLVNACWDWGFGDFETPLGAASHVGRRNIAEFLISKGARIDIFAAAMLGMTDVVKGYVVAIPGIQRTHGPHGIPLLAHAKAGGAQAALTLKYLEDLGDAGETTKVLPFTEERKKTLLGKYRMEDRDLEIKLNARGGLIVESTAKEGYKHTNILSHKGDDTFFPAGVPTVGFKFEIKEGQASSFVVSNPAGIIGVARRAGV